MSACNNDDSGVFLNTNDETVKSGLAVNSDKNVRTPVISVSDIIPLKK